MSNAPERPDLDEALDVQGDFAAKVPFHLVAAVDQLSEPVDLLFGEVAHPGVGLMLV